MKLIEIDDREDRDGITEILLAGMGYTPQRIRLPLGDFRWESPLGQVLVERKTPQDARDINRFYKQFMRLTKASREGGVFPILLIDHRPQKDEGLWEEFGLDNMCMSAQSVVRVAHCTQGQLAHRLDSIYQWTQKPKHDFVV